MNTSYTPQLTPETFEQLTSLCKTVLGVTDSTEDFMNLSFIQLGGDSLKAMEFSARAQLELGVSIPVSLLLGDECLALALTSTQIATNDSSMLPQEPTSETTSVQQGMWIMQELTGGSAYNLVFLTHFEGTIDSLQLQQAIEDTVAHHDGLRTHFQSTENGLKPVVKDRFKPKLDINFVRADTNFTDILKQTLENNRQDTFELDKAPPLKFVLVSDGADRHTLIFITHHMLLDGWGIGLVLKEILDRFESLTTGIPLTVNDAPRPGVFLQHQTRLREAGVVEHELEYWRNALRDVPTVIELPSDKWRPIQQVSSGKRMPYHLTIQTTEEIYRIAAELGVTPFAFLLSAYALLLTRYTGVRKFIIGVPWAGRPTPELQRLVALCTNLVPVVVEVDEHLTVGAYVKRIQRSLSHTIANPDVPFDELVRSLKVSGDARRNPLIQYVFAMHDQLIDRKRTINDTKIHIEDGHAGGSPFDMSLFVQYGRPMLGGELEFADSVLNESEIHTFLDNYLTMICQLVEAVEQKVESVRGISEIELARIRQLNETTVVYRGGCVEHLFLEQVQRTPGMTAVVGPNGQDVLTYQQLRHAAAIQADKLAQAGIAENDNVIVAVDRSIEQIVAVLGVLCIGAVYVAVDPQWPDSRLKTILEMTQAKAILADNEVANRLLRLHSDVRVTACPLWEREWMEKPEPKLRDTSIDQERLCYITFTSGTTGIPKGVSVRHRGVVRLVDNVDYLECGPGERFLRFAPLTFDASTLEIFGPLVNGGTCIIYPKGLPSPMDLVRFISERDVTRLWLTSGLFRLLAEFEPDGFRRVRQLLTGGDVVPAEHVQKVLSMHSNLIVTNGYGPTENTTFTTFFTMKSASDVEDPVPIGYPVPNTRCYVLDDRFRLVPPGGVGELFTGGDGLAAGYLHNDTDTKRCFGKFSPDVDEVLYRTGDLVRIDTKGRIQYLGRRDHQVKIRGYRIELEEVRRVIREHENVSDAVVVVTGANSSDRQLLAAVVLKEETENFVLELQDFISKTLPSYTIPAKWAVVNQIPVTANGKVDNKELEKYAATQTPKINRGEQSQALRDSNHLYALARDAIEKALDCRAIRDTDNFFDLGGDSLRMVRLLALIRKKTGHDLPLKEFYTQPTLAHLVELLEKAVSAV